MKQAAGQSVPDDIQGDGPLQGVVLGDTRQAQTKAGSGTPSKLPTGLETGLPQGEAQNASV